MAVNELVFKLSNGGRIKLINTVITTINGLIQKEDKSLEAGGVLLGRFIKDSKNIVIDKVTTPINGDKQTRYSFKRLSSLHQQVIDDEWKVSNGTCNYLGEWHTHPETDPGPSGVDIKDWKRKLNTDIFSSRFLYFIIAGTDYIRIWEGDRRTLKITKLSLVNEW